MDINQLKEIFKTYLSDYPWLFVGLVVFVLILSLLYKHRYYYQKKEYLCSRPEQVFLKQLLSILPKNYQIHCQTSLISLLKPADLRSARMVWAKRMDFVITDKASKILLVIELDDITHERKDRRKRDKFVNKVLKGKHPLLRISQDKIRNTLEIRREIERLIGDNHTQSVE